MFIIRRCTPSSAVLEGTLGFSAIFYIRPSGLRAASRAPPSGEFVENLPGRRMVRLRIRGFGGAKIR